MEALPFLSLHPRLGDGGLAQHGSPHAVAIDPGEASHPSAWLPPVNLLEIPLLMPRLLDVGTPYNLAWCHSPGSPKAVLGFPFQPRLFLNLMLW